MKRFFRPLLCLFFLPFFSACTSNQLQRSQYDLFLRYDDVTQTVDGQLSLTYFNDTDNELCELRLHLYPNAYRENALHPAIGDGYTAKAYYQGKSYGNMIVHSVEGANSWTMTGDDEAFLSVTLPTPCYPDQTVKLGIAYTVTLANVEHRTGVTPRTVNLGQCYPVLCHYTKDGFESYAYTTVGDPFVTDTADYVVTLDCPERFQATASGKRGERTETDGRAKQVFTATQARDFALVLSDKFKTVTTEVNGITLRYDYTTDQSPQSNLSVAQECVTYFCSTFGHPLQKSISLVQTGLCHSGMEYDGLCMLADDLDSDSTLYTVVHEIAHQWWYATVGSDQYNEAWQDEGLAEFSTMLFFESNPHYAFTRTALLQSATQAYRAYYSTYAQLFGETDTSMSRPLTDYDGYYAYANLTYNKGALLFHSLHEAIGKEKYVSGLRRYLATQRGKVATPDDLIGCFIHTGTDVEGLFDCFLKGKVIV